MSIANNPVFDKEEQDILSQIVPEAEPSEEVELQASADPQATPATSPEPAAQPAQQPQAQATPATEPTANSQPSEPAPPQGDLRAALRASRRAERRTEEENKRLKQELDDLKAGKAQVSTDLTDEEIAELEEVSPTHAKVARRQREIEEKLAQINGSATQTEFQPMVYEPELQDLIDGVPDLVSWQYDQSSQAKFHQAIEHDKALQADPAWSGKSVQARFAEAARLVKANSTPAAQAASRKDPAAVIAGAQSNGPQGISDFRGGAPANLSTVDYSRMSDEQIMASLPVG